MSTIPIANLYYLLSYAWDRLEQAETVHVSTSDYEHIPDLLAAVVAGGLEHLLMRGLDRGYLARQEQYAGIKGKLDISATISSNAMEYRRTVCWTDEFTADVIHNQIIKACAKLLLTCRDLDDRIRQRLHQCFNRLGQISDIHLIPASFRLVQLHRNNRFYDLVLHVCRLIFDTAVLEEGAGRVKFRDFTRDEKKMNQLFEKFLLNFYKRHAMGFDVRAIQMDWVAEAPNVRDLDHLPIMRTDICLRNRERMIIADAKYYVSPMQARREFGERLISAHLYQLLAYLRNWQIRHHPTHAPEGLLIYPKTDTELDAQYILQGYHVRVVTIDLSAAWHIIHKSLLSLITATEDGARPSGRSQNSQSESFRI